MDHLECFEKMLKGNLAFFELLINMAEGKHDNTFLSDRDNIKAAKVGAINLLLLSSTKATTFPHFLHLKNLIRYLLYLL